MLTREQILERNKRIKENGLQTRKKRMTQSCRTFKFKVDYSNLRKSQRESLKMMFVEAKWIYNYLLSQEDIYSIDYKNLTKVTHRDKDRNEIESSICHVRSSVKQELIAQIVNQIKGLSVLKRKGHQVGKLKFKSEFNSIKLKQYGITHSIRGSKFKIQGIKLPIRVLGLRQLSKYDNIDYTTANLLYDGNDYFISLTCFVDKDTNRTYDNDILGIDMGVSTSLTLSNGAKYDISIEESEKLKKLQAKLVRQRKGSNNRYKTIKRIRREYTHINNKKNDMSNKLVSKILKENRLVIIQDEQLTEWRQDGFSGTKLQHSILGRIKSKLASSDQVIILDKWFPTTKWCSECRSMTNLDLKDRMFECHTCKTKEDRDVHAANNMIHFYLRYIASGTGVKEPERKIKFSKHLLKQESDTTLVCR